MMTCYLCIHVLYDCLPPEEDSDIDVQATSTYEYKDDKENTTHILSPVTIAEILSTHRKLALVMVILGVLKYIANAIVAHLT